MTEQQQSPQSFELRLLAEKFMKSGQEHAFSMRHPHSERGDGSENGIWIPYSDYRAATDVCQWVAAQSAEIEKELEQARALAARERPVDIFRSAIDAVSKSLAGNPDVPRQEVVVRLTSRGLLLSEPDIETSVKLAVGEQL